MKHLQPVIWSKGTFLTPQHLQIQDRFIEDSLHFRLHALKFCSWGLTELCFDLERLAEGHLVVSRATGIFPDGLLFDVPDSDSAPASKSLGEHFEPGINNLDIFLAIPDYRPRGLNVALVQCNGNTRYVAEATSFRDENTGITERPIQIAR